MDKTRIINAFDELIKNFVQPQLHKIYSQIYQSVCNENPEALANKITSLESRAINEFYLELEGQVRQVAITAMRECGVPETQIPMTWLQVRRDVKAPQAKLCNQQGYPKTAPKIDAEHSEQQNQAPVGKWIVISGAVVEIVSWIFLPSYKVWAPIAKGIGILLIGSGVYKIYQEQKRESRISLSGEAIRAAKAESDASIKKICKQQCALNTGIYHAWIVLLRDEIIVECEKLS